MCYELLRYIGLRPTIDREIYKDNGLWVKCRSKYKGGDVIDYRCTIILLD